MYIISLKDNESGRTREILYQYCDTGHKTDEESEESLEFYWTDGNLSCDCNRLQQFYPDSKEIIDCGDERFELVSIKRIISIKEIEI